MAMARQVWREKACGLFGGLHIEMAALKAVSKWLEGSGWAQALVQAEIVTAGMADSFHKASHVRRAHQITSAALYILQHRAYDHSSLTCLIDNQSPLDFDTWCVTNIAIAPIFITGQL